MTAAKKCRDTVQVVKLQIHTMQPLNVKKSKHNVRLEGDKTIMLHKRIFNGTTKNVDLT